MAVATRRGQRGGGSESTVGPSLGFGSRTAQPVQTLKKQKKTKKNGLFKISRKSHIRPPRAVRAARGAFNVWLRTVYVAAILRPPIGVLADPAAT
jgi:hypothetical protein